MSLVCPKCNSSSLSIECSKELGPDAKYDERAIQVIKCYNCQFSGIAMYQESRRGALDSEIVHHEGFLAPQKKVKQLSSAIKQKRKINLDYFLKSEQSRDFYASFPIIFRSNR